MIDYGMPPRIETRKLMSVMDAARYLQIGRQAVWLAIAKGRLTTLKIAGTTFIHTQSVHDYKRTRHPGGPKSKKKS
jgi:hypothetical protein